MTESKRPSYGVDAPMVPVGFGIGCAVFLALLILTVAVGGSGLFIGWWAFWTAYCGAFLVSYLYTTSRGKFVVWRRLVDNFGLRGDERVLDLGCGRGMVLNTVARRLTTGTVTGVDLWRSVDQSGNDAQTTMDNAAAEGVADRVEIRTGDMTGLPFGDAEFDLVVSSLAVHNIKDADGREKAIDEAVRVLKPGGRLALADFQHTRDYAERLTQRGMANVSRRGLGPRFWYGGPWTGTSLVSADKPAASGEPAA